MAKQRRTRSWQRRSTEEMKHWLERRARDGLSFVRLSAISGIPKSTLEWWSRRLDQGQECASDEAEEASPAAFVEWTAAGADVGGPSCFEVTLRCGRKLQIPPGADMQEVRELVRTLEERC